MFDMQIALAFAIAAILANSTKYVVPSLVIWMIDFRIAVFVFRPRSTVDRSYERFRSLNWIKFPRFTLHQALPFL